MYCGRHVARGLAKWQHEFCDTAEIVLTLWSARRKQRQKQIEEKRIQKAELYVSIGEKLFYSAVGFILVPTLILIFSIKTLLEKLIKEDTQRKIDELFDQIESGMSDVIDEEFGTKIMTLDSEHVSTIYILKADFFSSTIFNRT